MLFVNIWSGSLMYGLNQIIWSRVEITCLLEHVVTSRDSLQQTDGSKGCQAFFLYSRFMHITFCAWLPLTR